MYMRDQQLHELAARQEGNKGSIQESTLWLYRGDIGFVFKFRLYIIHYIWNI